MIDWHCHILPGIDDGPATTDEAVQMAKILHQAGFSTVHCTPHLIRGSFEAGNDTVSMVLAALQAELDRQGISLRLLPGREYYLDEFLLDVLKDPLPLGETRYLLIEIPSHSPVEFVKETCYRISSSGFTPMIAHPERCVLFAPPEMVTDGWFSRFTILNPRLKTQNSSGLQSGAKPDTSLLGYLKEIGCAFQGNIGSFAGFYGERVRQRALRFLEMGAYSHLGSDAHGARRLERNLADGLATISGGIGVEGAEALLGSG